MINDNALVSFTARSVSFDVQTMTVTIASDAIKLTDAQAHAVRAVCVTAMRARQTVYSALMRARRAATTDEQVKAHSEAIKFYEKALNVKLQSDVRELIK